MIRAGITALLLVLVPLTGMAQVPEPTGFHGEPYRAPVPATLTGARVVTTPEAFDLHAQGVPFVDTMPRKKRPDNLPQGTIWAAPPHQTITGATWLFDTGYERISEAEETRLAEGLARVTHGDKTTPVVLFCQSDCWMSWNAAKRAVAMGYGGVIWYPDGADGWAMAGGALVTAVP